MTMKCISHHYACDCREEKIQEIFAMIRLDHDIRASDRSFISAIQEHGPEMLNSKGQIEISNVTCHCPICMRINELYSNLGKVTLG